ncbi:MAG: PEP-CTERM sorting domain-containing protein [Fimbriimonadaceae bacterium]|nr:PEP-CTERM sorting domain-containing protein [Fimbriimonadaceae bacterium]QYK55481.1 MAG: PEP-CTERM sorting domain-containing protein [Fimbriimonadaceae bacterium]
MKKLDTRAVCAAFVFAFVARAQAGPIVLVNGDFESGSLAPWAQTLDKGGPVNWTLTTSVVHTGDYAAMARGNKMLFQQVADVDAREVTSVSFALLNSDATFNAYRFFYSDQTWKEFTVDPLDDNWHVYEVSQNLDRSKTLTGLGIFGVNGGNTYWTYLDDVEITVVPEPATLLATSLALLALRRKR